MHEEYLVSPVVLCQMSHLILYCYLHSGASGLSLLKHVEAIDLS